MTLRNRFFKPMVPANLARCCGAPMLLILAQGGAFIIFVEEYGGDFTCAVLTDGNVQCWGANSYGQLGNGSAWRTTPTGVAVRRLYLPFLFHE